MPESIICFKSSTLSCGLPLLSKFTSSSFVPLSTPPFALTSSIAACSSRLRLSPTRANGPLNGSICATLMVSAAITEVPSSDIAIVHTNFDHMFRFIFVFLPKASLSKGVRYQLADWGLLPALHHALQVLQAGLIDAIEEFGQGTPVLCRAGVIRVGQRLEMRAPFDDAGSIPRILDAQHWRIIGRHN